MLILSQTTLTKEQVLQRLKECAADDDTEMAHVAADTALCEFLIALGHEDVVDAYNDVDKWFA
jgi:hypothetical protein|tara:strand:- start:404 stop:592 length:189 start_codon:yes stop_codon:yes gene_type:complete